MLESIPSPTALGLPEKFQSWRPGQEEGILRSFNSDKRFTLFNAPTGFGKTLYYVGRALATGERTMIVTATKGLQRQLHRELESVGLALVMGKSNYLCKTDEEWTCEHGFHGRCPDKDTPSCDYTAAYHRAYSSPIVVANYHYWININKYGSGLGPFDHLVLDEAHYAPQAIADAMEVRLSENEICEMLGERFPLRSDVVSEWKFWAARVKPLCDDLATQEQARISSTPAPKVSWIQKAQHLLNLSRKLATLILMRPDDWIIQEIDNGFRLDPIRIGRYAERTLFRNIPKVTFISATVRPKTLYMCNIKSDEFEHIEFPSCFPKENTPVYYVPTATLNKAISDEDIQRWVERTDEIIGRRLDRKGIIHTKSYERQKDLVVKTKYVRHMLFNKPNSLMHKTEEIVQRFKKGKPPLVLVSPSVTTGYDFPGRECEYQIISKVPFMPFTDPVTMARSALDSEYTAYHTMQEMVQATGRSTRTAKDRSEIFIIDNSIEWFWKRYRHLAPLWFHELIREVPAVPTPPPPIREAI